MTTVSLVSRAGERGEVGGVFTWRKDVLIIITPVAIVNLGFIVFPLGKRSVEEGAGEGEGGGGEVHLVLLLPHLLHHVDQVVEQLLVVQAPVNYLRDALAGKSCNRIQTKNSLPNGFVCSGS